VPFVNKLAAKRSRPFHTIAIRTVFDAYHVRRLFSTVRPKRTKIEYCDEKTIYYVRAACVTVKSTESLRSGRKTLARGRTNRDVDAFGRYSRASNTPTMLTTPFVSRDLNKHTKFFTLTFNDEAKEREYKYHKEAASGVSLIGCPLVLFLTCFAQIIILPRSATDK